MMTLRTHPFRVGCTVVALGALAAPARAQTATDSAAAQALFDAAKASMAAGNAAEACPKLEESERLDPRSGTLVNLARCYEETGRLASAWSTYLQAAVSAKAAGNAEREGGARELAAALAPRVSKLVVEVSAEARVPGLEISRDGALMGQPQWGLAIPEDDGEHTIVAKAPGYPEWRTVAVVKNGGMTTTVSVPPFTKTERVTAAPSVPSSAKPPPSQASVEQDQRSAGGSQKVIALVVGGVGVVGLGVGGVFLAEALAKKGDSDKFCSGGTCTTQQGVTLRDDARSAGTISTVLGLVGVAGVGIGAALFFTAPSSSERTAWQVSPIVFPGVSALVARRAF